MLQAAVAEQVPVGGSRPNLTLLQGGSVLIDDPSAVIDRLQTAFGLNTESADAHSEAHRSLMLGKWATSDVIRADSLEGESEALRRSVRVLGEVATGNTVDNSDKLKTGDPVESESLRTMLEKAHEGNEESRRGVRANVASFMWENMFKVGLVLRADANKNSDGQIVQFGQTTEQRQRNTLEAYPDQSPEMLKRSIVEGTNGFRLETNNLGRRKMIEFSLVPSGSRRELHDRNFYLETMTCIIRTTEFDQAGNCIITSILVGGVDEDSLPEVDNENPKASERMREEAALENRFDLDVVREIYHLFGVEDAYEMSETELLGTPLISEEMDGLDFAMIYDRLVGLRLGKEVMFGSSGVRRDYADVDVLDHSHYEQRAIQTLKIQSSFEPLIDSVTDALINSSSEADTNVAAIKLLSKIGMDMLVEFLAHSKPNKDVEEKALGLEAASAIQIAREAYARGDYEAGDRATDEAKKTARNTSCPLSERERKLMEDLQGNSNANDESNNSHRKEKMTCPFCGDKNQYGDPCSPNQHCTACKATVYNGKVVYKGNKVELKENGDKQSKITLKTILDRIKDDTQIKTASIVPKTDPKNADLN